MDAAASPPPSPSVVAVLVTDGRGPHLEEVLRALVAQDHPHLEVLVVAHGDGDPTARVHAVAPAARVHRAAGAAGRAEAANAVIGRVTGAEFYLFLHDDAAPDPGAVAALVAAADRSGADVVGPKLVRWDDHRRITQLGMGVDRVATILPYVEWGELDQGQHDGVREVFAVPGAFVLVRARRFEEVGGFDEAIHAERAGDLSLAWRARIAGATVVVTSAARVRHAEACTPGPAGARAARDRVRVLLTSDRWGTLLAVVPQALVLSVVEVLGALARGQPSRAAAGAAAWPSNLLRLPSLVAARRQVARFRTVSDREVARHQVRGLLGPRLAVRHLPGSRGAVAARGVTAVPVRGRMEADPAAWSPNTALVAAVLAGVLLVGSRHLLTRFVPAVGQLVPPGGGAGDLLAAWAGGWRTVGLGAEAATPDVAAALGLAGGALLGHVGTARTWLVLGLVPVGVVGAHRLLAPARSRRAQVAAAVAYAAVPLPYEALARGRWGDLAAYAAAPWLLARLARASGVPPFAAPSPAGPLGPLRGTGEVAGEGGRPDGGGPDHGAPGGDVAGHPLWQHVVATGTVTGAAGVLVPQAPLLVLLAGAGLVLGSLLVGEVRGCGRVAVAAAGGATVGAALLLPTALDVVTAPHGLERWLGGDDAGRGLAVPDVAASGAGAGGWRWAALAVAGAAAVPVLVGRRWRLGWAVRGWVVGLLAGGLVWAGGQGWLEVRQPDPGVVLAPGAAGLALAVGLGLSAVERDVAGRSARLGVRRLVAVVGLAALCASTTGVVAAAADGWWGMPRDDHAGVLRSVDGVVRSGPSRVLWVGDDELVPGGAGWPLGHHLVYTAATGRAVPGVADLWPATGDGASERLGATLSRAMDEGTTRLGAALAPEAVLFVAVPRSLAPSDHVVPDPAADRAAASLEVVLASQLDLEEVYDDRGLVVYRNTAALPLRTAAPAGRRGRPVPVLGGDAERGATGPVPGRVTVVQASTASARWQLRVGGRRADHGTADGWADAFAVERGGEATLAYRTAASVRLLRAMQVLLWLLAVAVAVRMRFGTATAPDHAPAGALGGSPGEAAPEAPAPLALPRAGAEPAGRPPAVPVADG